MDLPRWYGCGGAIAHIGWAYEFEAVSSVVGGIENPGKQPWIETLPVNVVPLAQVVGGRGGADGGSEINRGAIGGGEILPVVPIAPVFAIVLSGAVLTM